MTFRRLFKKLDRDKSGRKSHESESRPDTPSPNSSVRSAGPRLEASGAKSTLAIYSSMKEHAPTHSDTLQPQMTNTTKQSWANLTAFFNILNRTPVLGPLAAAIEDLSWFVTAYEDVATTREEYDTLRTQLEALFKDLNGHFSRSTSPIMTNEILTLCEAIQTELRGVYGTQDRNTISRYMQASHDQEKITGCYRRIQGHLERVVKLNASLNIWGIVDQQVTDSRLDRLNPSMSACYNSGEASVVQRRECAANTREQVLRDLKAWKDNRGGEKVCWLNGMAGTGKTTIVNTLCSVLDMHRELGASFFCTRSLPECRNVKLILPTIAYQLARFSNRFRSKLLQVLNSDPDVHTKVLRVQFQRMILEPLREVIGSLPPSLVVVIDALDECEDGDGVEQILEVLLERAPQLPIKFLVSSRPERHIREKVYHSTLKTQLVLHELDEKMVKADIATYLRAALASVMTPPTDEQLPALVERAGTLFIYAATVVRYIKRGDSAERLDAVLKMPGSGQESLHKTREIDQLYKAILTSALDADDLEQPEKDRMELVLHTVVCAQEPLTVDALASLLRLRRTQVQAALRSFWSVLHVSDSDASHRVSTLHASFSDYMLDSKRSKHLACNAQIHNGKLAELCFQRISRNDPQFNVCNLESSYTFDENVFRIDGDVKQNIPMDLLYACLYWEAHLELGRRSIEQTAVLQEFLSKRLLIWIEVLNLTKRIYRGIEMMGMAIQWLQAINDSKSDLALIRDARRFVTMFATSPVSRSTPHLYISMLASWPSNQPISRWYLTRTKNLAQIKGLEASHRQLGLLSLIPVGSQISSVAYSRNGVFFATGTNDGMIQIWDSVSCRMTIDPIKAHTTRIRALAISPDGTRICSGSHDGTLSIWDAQRGNLIARPFSHTSWVMSVDYSPDGRWLVSGESDGTVSIWNTAEWKVRGTPLNGNDGSVCSAVFSPNGSMIAVSSESLIHLWDPSNGRLKGKPLSGHTTYIRTLAFTPNGEHLISGSDDRTIRVWDVHSGQVAFRPLQDHLPAVDSVAVSPDGSLLVSAVQDDTMRIWDTATWNIHSMLKQTGTVRSVKFSPDGSRLVSGSADRNIRIWEVPDTEQGQISHNQPQGHTSWVRSVAFSPCGKYIVSGSQDMTVCIWDLEKRMLMSSPIHGHKSGVRSVGASADGGRIFSISMDRMIHVWERQTGQLVDTIGPVQTDGDYEPWYQQDWPAAFSFDDRRLICGSKSGRIYKWEAGKGSFELAEHSDAVYSIALSLDGQSFASGSLDGEVSFWDVRSGEMLHDSSREHFGRVCAIAFSPDSSLAASGSMDCTIRMWSTHTGSPVGDPLEGHTGGVRSVAFSHSAEQLVSGGQDCSVRVWDIASGTCFAVFRGHTHFVLSVAFSPDGTRVASGSCDMTIRLWNLPTYESSARDEYEVLSSESMARNNWSIDDEGWTRDPQGRLLLWVPPDLRSAILWPQNSMVLSRQGCIELDFSNASIGDEWACCFEPL